MPCCSIAFIRMYGIKLVLRYLRDPYAEHLLLSPDCSTSPVGFFGTILESVTKHLNTSLML